MAIVNVSNKQYNGTDQNQGILEYQIENGDSLPTGLTASNTGSTCLNVDTGALYVWHILRWVEQ